MSVAFDSVVTNPGRLSILTALAVEERQEFVELRRQTNLTDGNLASHAKRLAAAGLISVSKRFREGKPVTSISITPQGRTALEAHARRVLAAITYRRVSLGPIGSTGTAPAAEEVVAEPQRARAAAKPATEALKPVLVDEDWVD